MALPLELACIIASHLSPSDIIACSRTSRRWRHLFASPDIHQIMMQHIDPAREITDEAEQRLLVRAHASGRPIKYWQPNKRAAPQGWSTRNWVPRTHASPSGLQTPGPILAGRYLFHSKNGGELIDLMEGEITSLSLPEYTTHVALSDQVFGYKRWDGLYWTPLPDLKWQLFIPSQIGQSSVICIAASGSRIAIARHVRDGIQVDFTDGASHFQPLKLKPQPLIRLLLDPVRLIVASYTREQHTVDIISADSSHSIVHHGDFSSLQAWPQEMRILSTGTDTLIAIDRSSWSQMLSLNALAVLPISTKAAVWRNRIYQKELYLDPPSVIRSKSWDGKPGRDIGRLFSPCNQDAYRSASAHPRLLINDSFLIDYHSYGATLGYQEAFTAYTFDPAMPGAPIRNRDPEERSSEPRWSIA